MTSDRTILITGVTGNQGGAVARALQGTGFYLRGLTRMPDGERAAALARQGVDVVKGDLDDEATLRRALAGAWGVFGVQNTLEAGVEREEAQGKRLATLAREAGVKHFVYTSVGSAHKRTGIPHFDNKWRIEETVRGLRFPSHVILRPVFFMENLLAPFSLQGSTLAWALGQGTKLQMIAVDDIGWFGARAFTDAAALNRREIDLAGDVRTMPEAAEILTEALGRPGLEGHRREPARGSWDAAQWAGSGKTQVTRQDRASCGLEIARTRLICGAGYNQAIYHQGAKNMMTISVIVGSTRQGRFSEKPAQWILQQLRKTEAIEARLLDLRDFPMPFFDQPLPPAMPGRPPYEHDVVKKWTEQIAASDGFVFVTPEYNYGPSAVVKNAIDWVYPEWNRKAAAFVSYGSAMGARAVQQLRETAIEVQMAPIRSSVHIPVATLWAHFQGGDVEKCLAELEKQANTTIDDLLWWTAALKAAREC